MQFEFFINDLWKQDFESEFDREYFIIIKRELHRNLSDQNVKIEPPLNKIFNFTNFIKYNDIKVVIIGQDPYHTAGEANGIAFVSSFKKTPYSLRTIFRSIQKDFPGTKSLTYEQPYNWMYQGVMLLNSSLTVEVGKPGSHNKSIPWNMFIRAILFKLRNKKNIVYLLWGKTASNLSSVIKKKDNFILKGPHPGHYTAKAFIEQSYFKKTNRYLKFHNIEEIIW